MAFEIKDMVFRRAVLDSAVPGLDQVGTTEFYLESKEVPYVSLLAIIPFV